MLRLAKPRFRIFLAVFLLVLACSFVLALSLSLELSNEHPYLHTIEGSSSDVIVYVRPKIVGVLIECGRNVIHHTDRDCLSGRGDDGLNCGEIYAAVGRAERLGRGGEEHASGW